ncbi:MAG: FAD-binding protein [Acidimicrobiia bacterium]|nr:FAD-binding protein [Acidimicrobiia bacterium]
MDLSAFADAVGATDPVTIAGFGSHGGGVEGVRTVNAPAGIERIEPEEMTVRCGAGTPVDELAAALAEHGQQVTLPSGGTVGGSLAVGRSGVRRLGDGPVRDAVLQIGYVSAAGEVVKAGGPTVKNVSGFDLCRVLVGSWGTLGFLGEVILRTRPHAAREQWFAGSLDPFHVLRHVHRPAAVLWDGATTWVLLAGHPADVESQVRGLAVSEVPGPPDLPAGGRWSVPPAEVADQRGEFVAEVGVGIVHRHQAPPSRPVDPAVRELHRRIKHGFDPTGRLNPGVDVLTLGAAGAGA